jgi:hypothetical protein
MNRLLKRAADLAIVVHFRRRVARTLRKPNASQAVEPLRSKRCGCPYKLATTARRLTL